MNLGNYWGYFFWFSCTGDDIYVHFDPRSFSWNVSFDQGCKSIAGAIGKLESTPGAEDKLCYSLVKFEYCQEKKTAAENREVQVRYLGTICFVWK